MRAGIRPDRWLVYPEIEWLAPGELQADALADLITKGNRLSVFQLEETIGPERIAIAVAAGRQNPDAAAYAVFDRDAVEAVGIEIQKAPGGTPDTAVNDLHYDLSVGTAPKLLALAGVIANGEHEPILPKKVKELLKAGIESGQLDAQRIKKELREKL